MPIISSSDATAFETHGSCFHSYVAPSRGSDQLCAWRLEVPPGLEGVAHRPNREEVLLVLAGDLCLTLDGVRSTLHEGDVALVVADSELQVDAGAAGGACGSRPPPDSKRSPAMEPGSRPPGLSNATARSCANPRLEKEGTVVTLASTKAVPESELHCRTLSPEDLRLVRLQVSMWQPKSESVGFSWDPTELLAIVCQLSGKPAERLSRPLRIHLESLVHGRGATPRLPTRRPQQGSARRHRRQEQPQVTRLRFAAAS